MVKSLDQLRRQVEQLEKRNALIQKLNQQKRDMDENRRQLLDKVKKLKQSGQNYNVQNVRTGLRKFGKKASPLLSRLRTSLDNASRNF